MIFLAETKMNDNRVDGVRRRMGYPSGFNVSLIGKSGGLTLWWDIHLKVVIELFSKNLVDAHVRTVGASTWMRVTGIYGTAHRSEKAEFWQWLQHQLRPTSIHWLCSGDFNEFLWESEKTGGSPVLYNMPQYLADFMYSAKLVDLSFNGLSFTWRGTRNGDLVE